MGVEKNLDWNSHFARKWRHTAMCFPKMTLF